MSSTLARIWHAFANALASFLDEAAFRLGLACAVILGRVPLEVEKRPWNRALEAPVAVDVFDWTANRRIFTVLVWPPLESPPETAAYDHRERVRSVKEALARGASEMAWSTRYETDHGLVWNPQREVWVSDGFAFDGKETHDNAA